MSQIPEHESIQLTPLGVENLRRLAASEPVESGALQVPEGALPPPRTVHRALAQLGLGTPARWCVPLLVVSASRSTVLGACGFKTAPIDGRVEISYGIAPAERGRGFATVAIGELLQLAESSGLVREVVADVLPGNVASSRLVVRMGFSPAGLRTDVDGETIMRWACRLPHDGTSGPDPLRRNA